MVVRLKDSKIDSIEETETRRLKLVKLSSKSEGAALTIELPDVLCTGMAANQNVGVVIDSKPISKGNSTKLYVEGTVFKKNDSENLEIVGSIGGLRLILNLSKATPVQIKTFESDRFYLALN